MTAAQQMDQARTRKPSRWLRKTKLCVYHLQNNCCLGSSCLFAHSLNELQDGPDLFKTQMCQNFLEHGCTNSNCTYAHGDEELQPFPTLKQKLCKWHRKGKCRNGETCSFAHGRQDLRDDIGDAALQGGAQPPRPGYEAAHENTDYIAGPTSQGLASSEYAAAHENTGYIAGPTSQSYAIPTLANMVPVHTLAPQAQIAQRAQQTSQVLTYLSLQGAVPDSMQQYNAPMPDTMQLYHSPMPDPMQQYQYQVAVQEPAYWCNTVQNSRTPLSCKTAPFVPQAPCNPVMQQMQFAIRSTSEGATPCEEEASDDKSTSAETAGYLSD